MTALLLLVPQTPMLFMGEEFAASAPFRYFADHRPELAAQVKRGRDDFLAQFPSLTTPAAKRLRSDPADDTTFTVCKLDWTERTTHHQTVALHRDLLALRRQFGAPEDAVALDGSVVNERAFVLRWFGAASRLLVVNLGHRLHADPWPEPLIAPPEGAHWRVVWSSEDPRYGGAGTAALDTGDDGWWLPAEATVMLIPEAHAAAH
jgi:maltooligosyltrehalose trehalohydrolase